ncbi:XP_029636231.1uncharacterized protein LOC115211707 isoform X2 [Octopus vulgaris]|nr:uncharacterized protein LOC115211707 isoform X2 [Octopus sinensis]CAI9716161.1 XP_029636231.1uncharacterized protein LOC115211707 isoform X2 [Octopus vulgaris]
MGHKISRCPPVYRKEKSQHPPITIRPVSRDLMISYSHSNKDFMLYLKDTLEKNNISVWVDTADIGAGVDFLKKIGQAIIESKVFISIVSETSIHSKFCKDELSLAYISNKSIFPVSISSDENLLSAMDTGMRLKLAGMQWYKFLDKERYPETMNELLRDIKAVLNSINNKSNAESKRPQRSTKIYNKQNLETPIDYWDRKYTENQIDWNQFWYDLTCDYQGLFSAYTPDDQNWLKSILRWEMHITRDGCLKRDKFIEFCTVDGIVSSLWQRIEEQARESYAMKEVFNINSHVRVEAIENLSKFKSREVVDALIYLVTNDEEPNVRTVAAICLAQTGANDDITIQALIDVLEDKDRLVREAGCLALGRSQAHKAVPTLLELWRNDVIADVRTAAEVALQQIGGDEVKQAMHVTKMLGREIHELTKLAEKEA